MTCRDGHIPFPRPPAQIRNDTVLPGQTKACLPDLPEELRLYPDLGPSGIWRMGDLVGVSFLEKPMKMGRGPQVASTALAPKARVMIRRKDSLREDSVGHQRKYSQWNTITGLWMSTGEWCNPCGLPVITYTCTCVHIHTCAHTDTFMMRKSPPEIALTWSFFEFMETLLPWTPRDRRDCPQSSQVLPGPVYAPSTPLMVTWSYSPSSASCVQTLVQPWLSFQPAAQACTSPFASRNLSFLICKMKGRSGVSLRPSAASASEQQGLLGSQVEAISQITEPHLATIVRGPPLGIGRLETLPSIFVNIWLKHSPNPNLILSIWGEN